MNILVIRQTSLGGVLSASARSGNVVYILIRKFQKYDIFYIK